MPPECLDPTKTGDAIRPDTAQSKRRPLERQLDWRTVDRVFYVAPVHFHSHVAVGPSSIYNTAFVLSTVLQGRSGLIQHQSEEWL